MRSLQLLLMSMALLAAPAARGDDTAAAARATLRRVAAMTPQQQQAWLRELKSRLDWANRLALRPEDAARQEARVAAMLHQKTVSLQTLLELVRELDTRERDAVARLVAQYRSESFQTFGGQGPEFTRRQEAWYRVWDLWTTAGSPRDQQDRLIAWLEGAIRNTVPGKIGPLPPEPKFSHPGESPVMVAARTPVKAKSALPAPASAGVEPDRRASRIKSPAMEVAAAGLPEARSVPPPLVPQRRTLSHESITDQIAATVPSSRDRGAAMVLSPAEPVRPTPPSLPEKMGPRIPLPPVDGRDESDGEKKAQIHSSVHLNAPSPPAPLPRGEGSRVIQSPEVSVAVTPRPRLESRPTLSGSALSPERPPMQQDLLAMLPPTRLVPLPEARNATKVGTAPLGEQKQGHVPADGTAEAAPVAVKVNVEELTAQIAGNKVALRALEAELDEKGPWNAARLESLVRRLDALMVKQKDLALFRDLITPAEQALVGRIAASGQMISQLAARIVDARTAAQGNDFHGSQSDRQAELGRLDALSTRLGNMAAEK